jgi:hypothetical protein
MKDTAIAVYIDNTEYQTTEFGWLYNSWLLSGSWRMSNIVAFHHPAISHDVLPKDNDIEYIPLVPLTEREPEWEEYPFINSIWYLTTPDAAILTKYKYVLRTDCDCFLTPFFPNLRPRLAQFGAGMFATETDVIIKLIEIAKKWGITPVFNNIGSTFMAYNNTALHYAQIHMEYCRKLKAEEFKDGYGAWPGWYQGVLTMYAGQLAACAVFNYGMTIGGLDVHCMSQEQMSPQDYHIHAWHTNGYFSKHKWREGGYRDYDMNALDKTSIADYCLWIAGPGPEVIR